MASKFKLEKPLQGILGIEWADQAKERFYLRAVKATTDVKELKAKNRKVPQTSKFGEPKTLGEISCDVRNLKIEATRGKTCLGIMLCENDEKVNFGVPATIS